MTRTHLQTHIDALIAICEHAEACDHPQTATGAVGGSSFGSRPPGRMNAPKLMRDLDRLLASTVRSARALTENAHVACERNTPVERIGGIEVEGARQFIASAMRGRRDAMRGRT